METEAPFFCNINALSASERAEHHALTRRMSTSIVRTDELDIGYAFKLDAGRMSFRDLATWTDYESRCCPFFDFTLELRREAGPLTLRLTGRPGVKEFIRSEFPSHFR